MPKRLDEDLIAEIERLAEDGHGATDIVRKLERRSRFVGRVPERRTVQNHVTRVREQRGNDWWPGVQLGEDPRQSAAALAVVGHTLRRSRGRLRQLTMREVNWIGHLSAMYPDMPPGPLWRLAVVYGQQDATNDTTAALDVYLTYHPWRSYEDLDAYQADIARYELPALPMPLRIETVVSLRLRAYATMRSRIGHGPPATAHKHQDTPASTEV